MNNITPSPWLPAAKEFPTLLDTQQFLDQYAPEQLAQTEITYDGSSFFFRKQGCSTILQKWKEACFPCWKEDIGDAQTAYHKIAQELSSDLKGNPEELVGGSRSLLRKELERRWSNFNTQFAMQEKISGEALKNLLTHEAAKQEIPRPFFTTTLELVSPQKVTIKKEEMPLLRKKELPFLSYQATQGSSTVALQDREEGMKKAVGAEISNAVQEKGDLFSFKEQLKTANGQWQDFLTRNQKTTKIMMNLATASVSTRKINNKELDNQLYRLFPMVKENMEVWDEVLASLKQISLISVSLEFSAKNKEEIKRLYYRGREAHLLYFEHQLYFLEQVVQKNPEVSASSVFRLKEMREQFLGEVYSAKIESSRSGEEHAAALGEEPTRWPSFLGVVEQRHQPVAGGASRQPFPGVEALIKNRGEGGPSVKSSQLGYQAQPSLLSRGAFYRKEILSPTSQPRHDLCQAYIQESSDPEFFGFAYNPAKEPSFGMTEGLKFFIP